MRICCIHRTWQGSIALKTELYTWFRTCGHLDKGLAKKFSDTVVYFYAWKTKEGEKRKRQEGGKKGRKARKQKKTLTPLRWDSGWPCWQYKGSWQGARSGGKPGLASLCCAVAAGRAPSSRLWAPQNTTSWPVNHASHQPSTTACQNVLYRLSNLTQVFPQRQRPDR